MVVPAGTPKPIIDKLQTAIAKIAAEPDMIERFKIQGVEISSSTPDGIQGVVSQGGEGLDDADQEQDHQGRK